MTHPAPEQTTANTSASGTTSPAAGVSETDTASLRATAARLDTLVKEVQEHRDLYKGLLRDVTTAAAEGTVSGSPGGIYQPPLEAMGTLFKHIGKQLGNLEESLSKTAAVMRKHATDTEHGESVAASRFRDA